MSNNQKTLSDLYWEDNKLMNDIEHQTILSYQVSANLNRDIDKRKKVQEEIARIQEEIKNEL